MPLSDIKTEKQLHQDDGFGIRTHQPDFTFTKDKRSYCVEVELSIKSKARLERNIKDNFLKYDTQIWIVDEPESQNGAKLKRILKSYKKLYPNMKVLNVSEVKNYVFGFNN